MEVNDKIECKDYAEDKDIGNKPFDSKTCDTIYDGDTKTGDRIGYGTVNVGGRYCLPNLEKLPN